MAEDVEYTEAEYREAQRLSDQNAVGYVLIVLLSGVVALGLSAVSGLAAGWACLLVMVPSVGGFVAWAGRRSQNAPPPRRERVRMLWPSKALAVVLGVGLAALLFVGLVMQLVGD